MQSIVNIFRKYFRDNFSDIRLHVWYIYQVITTCPNVEQIDKK